MIDRTTKALLFAIALGLWMNVVTDWARPTPVLAQGGIFGDPQLSSINTHLQHISIDTGAMSISLRSLALADDLRRRK